MLLPVVIHILLGVAIGPVNSGGLGILLGRDTDGGKVALGVDVLANRRNRLSRCVNSDRDVSNETVLQAVAELGDVDDGRVAIAVGRAVQRVLGVGRAVERQLVRRVRAEVVHVLQEVLLEEELADVLDGRLGVARAVRDVGLGGDVDVRSPRHVVAGEGGQELDHAVVVGDLNAAQEGLVVGRAVVALCPAVKKLDGVGVDSREGGVAACRVAVPDGQRDAGQWLASLEVDHADVEVEVDAGLVLAEVVANHFTVDTRYLLDSVNIPITF